MYLHRPLCEDCDKIPEGRTSMWTYVFLQGRQWETFRGRTWNRNQPDPVRGPPVHQNLPFLQVKSVLGIRHISVRSRIRESINRTNWSGSCYFRQWPSMATKQINFFTKFFCLLLLGLDLHHFSKIKSHKEVPKQEEWRFSLLFLLDDRRSRIRIREAQNIRIWIP